MPRNHNTRRGRKTNIRNEREVFYLITEGNCTEIQYFEMLRKDYNIIVKKSKRTDALGIVKEVKKAKYQDGFETNIWAIFDVDQNSNQQLEQAIGLANRNNIKVGVSNQCFELWLFLHYDLLSSSTHRSGYATKLERIANTNLGCAGFVYDKKIDPFLGSLESNIGTAIRNAKRLLNRNDPHRCMLTNPSTTVVFLVEEILEKAKRS